MTAVLIFSVRMGAAVLAAITLAGMLAPLLPGADIVNHFRPWILLSAVLLLVLAPSRAKVAALGIGIVALNASLMALPLASNQILDARTAAYAAAGEFKLLSINVLTGNKTPERVAEFVASENADVVLLQEMSKRMRDAILPRLAKHYPHIHRCNCQSMVLLSKKSWLSAGGQPRNKAQPPLIWARFRSGGNQAFQVMGIHTTYPLNPGGHTRQYDWLTNRFPKFDEPLILAGDFNAAPWSWNLFRFGWASGLSRAFTFSFSWPSHWPFQLLIIDNIFVSKHVRLKSTRIGPDVGSDHRPIIAAVQIGR